MKAVGSIKVLVENMNIIDRILARLNRKNGKKIQITNIRNESDMSLKILQVLKG